MSTQHHNQQVLAKPHHNPSNRDQQAREKLQQKVKIRSRVYIQLREETLQTIHRTFQPEVPIIFTFTGFSRWISKFKINFNPYPVFNTRRLKLFRNHRLLLH